MAMEKIKRERARFMGLMVEEKGRWTTWRKTEMVETVMWMMERIEHVAR
jgi:hypothetical protein